MPKLLEKNQIRFENWVTLTNEYQKLVWSGIGKYNDEVCAIVKFESLCNPVEILADDNGFVTALRCVKMELGEPDASGRRKPVVVPGSEFDIPCDVVIIAIGNTPNPLIPSTTPDINVSKWGTIVTDETTGRTSKKFVYAGGDIVTGAATVILAMGAGKIAAKSIIEDLQQL